MDNLANDAIKCALNQRWKQAIKINLKLLDTDDDNVEALNRLAYAYLKTGHLRAAQTTYKKVLKIDKYNPIASKNIAWLTNLTKQDIHHDCFESASPTIFLEEPGKTKIVTLVHPAPARILCNFMTAQKVCLIPRRHSIEIRDGKGTYIGALPDDLAHRLLRLITCGNSYDAYIKSVEKNAVSIFIREIKRGKRYAQIPSFQILNGSNTSWKTSSQKKSEEEEGEGNEDEGES